MVTPAPLRSLLERSAAARQPLLGAPHTGALRLFNGFTEGFPDLAVDLYGCTLLIHDYSESPAQGMAAVAEAQDYYRTSLSWLRAGVLKRRNGASTEERRGRRLFGAAPDDRIEEHGVRHAIDLTLNRDASFYLDTRRLRQWLIENVRGRTVLNTFAYTGSLGTAARAGGASRVVQLDRSRRFLALARRSYELNGLPLDERDLMAADFFAQVGRFKRHGARFDCVLVDPPFFAAGPGGTVNQVNESARLINKVRPLIHDGGCLVAVNNALFVSGAAYMQSLEALCADGYLSIRELVPVPEDLTGYAGTRASPFVTDPAPFNHPTKIVILDVRRKPEPEERRES